MTSILLINQDPVVQKEAINQRLSLLKMTKDSPNVLWVESEENSKLSIKEVKKIKDHFYLRPWDGSNQIIVIISAERLTDDAQNALLKVLEEPPATGQLILTANSTDGLLPTIISRCQVETIQLKIDSPRFAGEAGNEQLTMKSLNIQKLLSSTLEERFQIIEKTEDKDQLLLELEKYFSEALKTDPSTLFANKLILQAKEWSRANGNIRGILEYLILSIK